MHSSFEHTAHRPWPLPEHPWRWRQSWQQLAFFHYRIDAEALQARLPHDLVVQQFDGSAWVAIVPFRMADMMRGSWPSLPPLRCFPELNLRTYVERNGRPGVWFFSLDADCWPLVLGGRLLYGLPYYKAQMSLVESGKGVEFSSLRFRHPMKFHASYHSVGPVFSSAPGSFEYWATERYCLYSRKGGATLSLQVHHRPWPLQLAEAEVEGSDVFRAAKLTVRDHSPVCHFSAGVEVVSYSPDR